MKGVFFNDAVLSVCVCLCVGFVFECLVRF